MRICSLLPSATEIVAELGLADSLVGVSEECRWPAEVLGKPVVTGARIDPASLTSLEIDRAVRESLRDGRSLYAVDADVVAELRPDVIVTQDLCSVCAVSSGELASACPVGARVVSLDPRSLADVARTVADLAELLGVPERGAEVVHRMREQIRAVERCVAGLPRRRLFFAEWIDPPFCAGHWIPEMIERAGAVDVLGVAGRPSYRTTWERVRECAPELVVIAPCGFGADEAARRAGGVDLPVRTVAVDGDGFYSRPVPRLAQGVQQLAHLCHPDAVPDPGLPALELPRPALTPVSSASHGGLIAPL